MGQTKAQHVHDTTLFNGFEHPVLPHLQMDYTETVDTGNYAFDGMPDNPSYPNYYTIAFYGKKVSDRSFEGFTCSNIIDTIGIDSLGRRDAFPGSGHNGSAQYAVTHGLGLRCMVCG